MNIETLAKQKTQLDSSLQAMQMCNVYGKSLQEMTELNLAIIRARKTLYEVEGKIKDYIEGRPI